MTRGPEDVYDDVAVDAWIQDDPDPVTRAELTELLSAARSHGEQAQTARSALSDAFSGTLASVSYTHLTLPTIALLCRSRWAPGQ